MYKLFDGISMTEIFCDHFEPGCIRKAVDDLKRDICKISGRKPVVKRFLPGEDKGYMVIGSLQNPRFTSFLDQNGLDISALEGQWEHYMIQTFGPNDSNLLICGSDERGAMWGIYEFCEKYLGIDPMYFWTDNEPKRRGELSVSPVNFTDGPKTFKFRGWFLNDEDLLTEWRNGGGKRYIDYPYYHQVVHQDIMEKVIETALRLKQNLIIPASFVDIDNPPEENFVRMVTQRGMFITQHHVEPMGVSHFGWDNFWRKRGEDIEASFVKYPEKFEEIWTYYAEKWARYKNVIWQFGLRGRGDRPVWFSDSNVPPSMEERGRLISSALEKQAEIVEKVLGHNDFYSTTTLWMEGTELHDKGYLTFPEKTMIIFADFGPSQMWGSDFYNTRREPGREYGVYYHVAFWGDGPHLVQGTSLDKIYYNYKEVVERGDTCYSILNVTNIREMVFGIRAVQQITWDFNSFDKKDFIKKWIKSQFGETAVESVSKAYSSFFTAYHELEDTRIPGHMVLLDGMVRSVGLKLVDILNNIDRKPDFVLNNRLFCFGSVEEMVDYYKAAAAKSLRKWEEAYHLAYKAMSNVETTRRQYFTDHFIVQTEIIMGLYMWMYQLCLAAEARLKENDMDSYRRCVEKAVFALEKLLIDRKKAEHGKWENWYRGDKKMNLPSVLEKTCNLLHKTNS